MKKNQAIILAVLMATGAVAQNSTPPALTVPGTNAAPAAAPAPPPPTMEIPPAPAKKTTAPKAKPAPKAAPKPVTKAKKPAAEEAAGAPFTENEMAIAKQDNIRIRAQSHINSEIIMLLKQGQEVKVLKEVTLTKPKTDEPARWAQIALPDGSHAWVNSSFIDANKTVTAKNLNIRSGAGENYSVIGDLHKGDAVKVVSTKGDWTEIEAPAGSFGYVAAHLLGHKPPATPPPPLITTVAPTPAPTVVPPSEPPPRVVQTAPVIPIPVIPTPAPAPAVVDNGPPPKRIVSREGSVGDTVSIQAPTYFQLESNDTGKAIDYLFSSTTNLVLERWRGRKVLVTGEESLDERWPNIPVLTVQQIRILPPK